jgi:hypothetical protein
MELTRPPSLVLGVQEVDGPKGPQHKVSLSMKLVDQTTGIDQDPTNAEAEQEFMSRRPANSGLGNKVKYN